MGTRARCSGRLLHESSSTISVCAYVNCSNRGVMKCSGCLGAWYCSSARQGADWRSHAPGRRVRRGCMRKMPNNIQPDSGRTAQVMIDDELFRAVSSLVWSIHHGQGHGVYRQSSCLIEPVRVTCSAHEFTLYTSEPNWVLSSVMQSMRGRAGTHNCFILLARGVTIRARRPHWHGKYASSRHDATELYVSGSEYERANTCEDVDQGSVWKWRSLRRAGVLKGILLRSHEA